MEGGGEDRGGNWIFVSSPFHTLVPPPPSPPMSTEKKVVNKLFCGEVTEKVA